MATNASADFGFFAARAARVAFASSKRRNSKRWIAASRANARTFVGSPFVTAVSDASACL